MPLLICPNCNLGMTQVQRSGVEIDICPQCRGVWLDRGELEKLLQPLREAETVPPQPSFLPEGAASPWGHPAPAPYAPYHDDHHDGHHGDKHHGHHGDWHGHQKQKGWRGLLDVFD